MTVRRIEISPSEISTSLGVRGDKLTELLELIRKAQVPLAREFEVLEAGARRVVRVERRGVGPLEPPFGDFWNFEFFLDDGWGSYQALVKAELNYRTLLPAFDYNREIVLRTDSGCSSGQRFGDQTCDCQAQLMLAMEAITNHGQGLIVHIPEQDGRGKGLPFKLGTLWIQKALGLDTVVSASLLTEDDLIDVRTYAGSVAVLRFLEVSQAARLVVATNNPEKLRCLQDNGFRVCDILPVATPPTSKTAHHFQAKIRHLGHQGLRTTEG